jgi:three-Cys-motif partner protein
LAFFELPGPAQRLRTDIATARPGDQRWQVVEGDCNESLSAALASLNSVRWAPTFAFVDPRGLQVAWTTVSALAEWRRDKKTKVEQWILMPEPALARVLGLRGVQGRRSAERLDRLFGSRDWLPIHQGRRSGDLSAEAMRAEFVNLYRWRLENDLGYQTTHALQIVNTAGHPVYTLIFATDSSPGDAIMAHLYGSAATSTIPEMQARAQVARQHRRQDEIGVVRLPGMDEFAIEAAKGAPGSYQHEPPWQPTPVVDDALDLDDQPDIDPDDIEWDNDPDDPAQGAQA